MRFKKNLRVDPVSGTTRLGRNVLHDTEYIESFSDSSSILDDISLHCVYPESKLFVKEVMTSFTKNRTDLLARQQFFASMNVVKLDDLVRLSNDGIQSAAWFVSEKDEEFDRVLESVLFKWKFLRMLNMSHTALQTRNSYNIYISPIFSVLSPVIYMTVPLLVLRFKYGINIPISFYTRTLLSMSMASVRQTDSQTVRNVSILSYALSGFIYCQGCYNTFSTSIQSKSICDLIKRHTRNLLQLFKRANDLTEMFKHSNPNPFFTFTTVGDVESNVHGIGGYLKTYSNMSNPNIQKVVDIIFASDALLAIKKYMVQNKLNPTSYDFNETTPRYTFKNSWHVSLDSNKVIMNTIKNSSTKRNCIVTGPNAAGKSTFIKSMLVNVLFSQSIAFSASEVSHITPFDFIGSQISIPDCKGKESLFEAEMNRSREHIEYIQSNPKELCLLFLDELFNSTNPVEGLAGSHSIVKTLGKKNNVAVVMTTHFDMLCDLNSNRYALYKFSCKIEEGENVSYDYRLLPGTNKQLVALDILEINGFDKALIAEAKKLKRILGEKSAENDLEN